MPFIGKEEEECVNKIILILMLLIPGLCISAGAQSIDPDSDFYAKTLPIYKVYSHALGLKVIYHKVGLKQGVVYLPITWFTKAEGAGSIIYGGDNSYPYLTVFYRAGKFDHISLFLQESREHLSWSLLYLSADEANKRFNIDLESFKIEY